jgi:putative hemolysin
MDSVSVALALIGLLILLNAVFAGSELALISLHRGEVERLTNRGRAGRALARLLHDPNRFLATIQLGVTLTGFLASATAAVALATLTARYLGGLGAAAEPVAVVLVTIGLTLITLVVGELTPKRLALQHPTGWALVMSRPLDALARLATPVIWLLSRATNACVRLLGGDPGATRHEPTEQQIADLVGSHGVYGHAHRRIITSALTLGQRSLKEVVVPRRDVLALPEDLAAAEALQRLVRSGHSRAPVYRDTFDDADRVVAAIALVGSQGRVRDHARSVPALPETLDVVEGLHRLQSSRRQLALVVDEYGGVEGIVTVEDLVEELVGDIYDEHDRPQERPSRRDDGALELPGRFPVHELEQVGIQLTARRSAATVGGLVSLQLGRLPDPGDVVEVEGYRITVLSVAGRAVRRLLVEPSVRPATPHDPRAPRSAR